MLNIFLIYVDLLRNIDHTQEYYSLNFTLPGIEIEQDQKIYIRSCYIEIYEEVIELVKLEKLPPTYYHYYLITGIPGIGKTQFIPYFLSRFLNDTEHQSFFIQTDPKTVYYYDSKGITKMDSVPDHLLHIPLFVDIKYRAEPFDTDYVFIFNSPDPAYHKQFGKEGYRLVINTLALYY